MKHFVHLKMHLQIAGLGPLKSFCWRPSVKDGKSPINGCPASKVGPTARGCKLIPGLSHLHDPGFEKLRNFHSTGSTLRTKRWPMVQWAAQCRIIFPQWKVPALPNLPQLAPVTTIVASTPPPPPSSYSRVSNFDRSDPDHPPFALSLLLIFAPFSVSVDLWNLRAPPRREPPWHGHSCRIFASISMSQLERWLWRGSVPRGSRSSPRRGLRQGEPVQEAGKRGKFGARGAAKGRRGAALRRLSCNRSTEAVAQTLLSRLEPKKLLSLNLPSHRLFWAVLAGSGTVQDCKSSIFLFQTAAMGQDVGWDFQLANRLRIGKSRNSELEWLSEWRVKVEQK